MKLSSVRLKDVLSHEDTHVEMGENLTVFTGVSDSGKSTCLRGLRFALLNKPDGIDLLRHGVRRGECSEVHVGVVGEDGTPHTIVRRRGRSRNEYEVDGATLRAFGLGSPEEVNQVAQLSEHAFQLQSDGHFLLSATDGEIARVLGSTVGLDQIDGAFTEVRRIKSDNDTALRVAAADVVREQQQLAAFEGLDDVVACVDRAVRVQERYDGLLATCAEMRRLLTATTALRQDATGEVDTVAERVRVVVERTSAIESTANVRNSVQAKIEASMTMRPPAYTAHADTTVEKVRVLTELIAEKASCVAQFRGATARVDDLRGQVDPSYFDRVADGIDKLSGICAKKATLLHTADELTDADRRCRRVDEDCRLSEAEERRETKEYGEFLRTTPICPECGSEQQYWADKERG